ncbi:unnamed protein product [Miscanthus lutarioriparius]|uniref:Uncharacterized protein n=1 Tax=Miscanthus lutarioriparius TaxID=422564 RepID=A0A811Q4E1_9POAL|nr:unnamed protein product [Miscanthus lutarioriparius]
MATGVGATRRCLLPPIRLCYCGRRNPSCLISMTPDASQATTSAGRPTKPVRGLVIADGGGALPRPLNLADNLYKFMFRMKDVSGAFRMHDGGEIDVRASYTAISVASLVNILDVELAKGVGDFIASCQTYEGGIAGEPYAEAHGGYTFCGLAALILLNEAEKVDLPSLILGPSTKFTYASHKAVSEYKEAKALGIDTVLVLVGPVSYLLLSKPAKGVEKSFSLLSLLGSILPIYKEVVSELKAAGASWIQFDEPTLVKDLDAHELAAFSMSIHDQLVEGANRMLRVAKEVLASQTARQVNQLLLQDTDVTEHDEDAA